MNWTPGDVSGSQTLTNSDHLFAAYINELRAANTGEPYAITVGPAGSNADLVCTGTNDNVMFKTAVDYALSHNAEVIVKGGAYSFSAPVMATVTGQRLRIVFMPGTVVTNASTTASHAGGDVFYFTGDGVQGPTGAFIDLQNPNIIGNSTGGWGIYLDSFFQGRIVSPRISGFTNGATWGVGLGLHSCIEVDVYDPSISGSTRSNVEFTGSCNINNFFGGWITGAVGAAANVRNTGGYSNRFYGTVIQGSGSSYGAVCNGRATTFIGCWFENLVTAIYCSEPTTLLHNCHFAGNTLDFDVQFASTDLVVDTCHFDTPVTAILRSGSIRPTFRNNVGPSGGGLSSVTDQGAVQPRVENNVGFNPVGVYAQGSVTGATTFNRVNGNKITATQTGNIIVTLTAGKAIYDTLELDIVTGGFTQSWPGNLKLAGGSCVMTGRSVLKIEWDGTNWVEIGRALNVS